MEEGYVENTILWRNVGRVDFRITESGRTAVTQGDFTGADFEVMKRALNNSGKTMGSASPQFSFDIASTEAFIKELDRKSTRLNSSHVRISYAVFCLKKKRK